MSTNSEINKPAERQRTVLILVAILATAVALRLLMSFYLGEAISEIRAGTYDQISYDALAQRFVDGYGFSFASNSWPYARANEPTAFWSYLYTFYLAGVYKLFGHHPLLARLIQSVLVGLLLPWFTYRLARRLFNVRTALLSAAIAAFYAYFIIYGASLMTEAFYIVGILWCVDVAMRFAANIGSPLPQKLRSAKLSNALLGLELGVAMGVTLLLRQVIVLFFALLFLWLLWVAWRRRLFWPAARALLLAGLISLLLLFPFILGNYQQFGRISLPNTNAGFAFFWSNHPIYGTRFEPVLSKTHGVSYQELIPPELRELNEVELDRALLARGLQFVRADPARYMRLSLSRIPVYFLFWPTATSSLLSNAARVLSFGILLPFILLGLLLAIRSLPQRCATRLTRRYDSCAADLRCEYLLLVFSFLVSYTLVHLLSWANVRYRLPVDAFLIMFAAYALDRILKRWSAFRNEKAGGSDVGPAAHG